MATKKKAIKKAAPKKSIRKAAHSAIMNFTTHSGVTINGLTGCTPPRPAGCQCLPVLQDDGTYVNQWVKVPGGA